MQRSVSGGRPSCRASRRFCALRACRCRAPVPSEDSGRPEARASAADAADAAAASRAHLLRHSRFRETRAVCKALPCALSSGLARLKQTSRTGVQRMTAPAPVVPVPAAAAGVREVLLQGRASFSLKPRARSRRSCGKGSCGGCGRQGRHGDDDPSSRKHENSSQGLFSNPAADAAQCSALRSSPRSPALSSNPWFTSLSSSASSSWRGPSSDSSSSS